MGIQLIETINVGSGGATSLEWLNIPQDGSDLMIQMSARGNDTNRNIGMRLYYNNDFTQGNYKFTNLVANGSGEFAGSGSFAPPIQIQGDSSTTNVFSSSSIYITNYAATSRKGLKSESITENNAALATMAILSGQYTPTSPITRIKLVTDAVSFLQHSTASLYKVTAD
tara:strand:- start:245 stop:751 length:507 start_codon:yes stop_codon:yes gene_type:complete